MMKKTYFAPVAEVLSVNVEMPLAGSVLSEIGIGSGGTDNGTHEPGVKENIFEENAFSANPFE